MQVDAVHSGEHLRAFHRRGLVNTGEAKSVTAAHVAPVDIREGMWSMECVGMHSVCLIQGEDTTRNRTANVPHPSEVDP